MVNISNSYQLIAFRGLHYVAKNVTERLRDIAEELPQYDIACLQEVSPCNKILTFHVRYGAIMITI